MKKKAARGRAIAVDGSLVVARRTSIHVVELDHEAVLLDEENDRLHHLNPSGTLVWKCYDGVSTLREIAADLSDGLGEDPATVLDHTLAVTQELVSENLLEVRG